MFDSFLQAWARSSTASRSCRSTTRRLRPSTSTGSPVWTASGTFWLRGASNSPRARPTIPATADTVNGLGRRKNDLVLRRHPSETVSPPIPARSLCSGGQGRRSVAGGGLLVEQLPRRARGRRHPGSFPGDRRRRGGRAGASPGQAGAGHLPGRGPAPRRRPVGRGGLRGRPGGGRVRAGRPFRLRRRRRPRRSGRGPESSTVPTGWSRTSASCSTRTADRDRPPGVRRRRVVGGRDQPQPGSPGPDRVGVRPGQRPHRLPRQPGRGGAARPAGNLSRLLLRAAAADRARS